jgi:ribosome biogenesis GTPase
MSEPESCGLSQCSLRQLGWGPFFQAQITGSHRGELIPARVVAVHRSGLTLVFEGGRVDIPLSGRWFQRPPEQRPTIGDWVLLNRQRNSVERLLERRSLLKRVASGRTRDVQLLAANVDTMFLVSSCNEDFNPGRIERYLTLALEAGVEPVVVLTKSDQVTDPDAYADAVRALKTDLEVEVVDAREAATLSGVTAWCGEGQTVALLGSSGVGKSTLVNTLSGAQVQLTQEIREDDGKGRHTTTHRSLHLLPQGGLVVDNPGMRELSLTEADEGVQALFADIDDLGNRCRFRNCQHLREPGCAVQAAIVAGELDPRRLDSYRKLQQR